jgi:hypothetical protein
MLMIVLVSDNNQAAPLIVYSSLILRLWTPSFQYVSSSCVSVLLTYQHSPFKKPMTPAMSLRARLQPCNVCSSGRRIGRP